MPIAQFPCLYNILICKIFQAHWEHVSTMWKIDSDSATLKVTPKLTKTHLFPNGFEKMRLDLAFQVFSAAVVHCIDLHKDKIESQYPNVDPTRIFINLAANLIDAMTSRFPAEALR